MQEDLAARCASLHAELESMFAQPVWNRARILQLRRQLDLAQRRQAALIRSQAREAWLGAPGQGVGDRHGSAGQRA